MDAGDRRILAAGAGLGAGICFFLLSCSAIISAVWLIAGDDPFAIAFGITQALVAGVGCLIATRCWEAAQDYTHGEVAGVRVAWLYLFTLGVSCLWGLFLLGLPTFFELCMTTIWWLLILALILLRRIGLRLTRCWAAGAAL
jgi:hypothetical protein